MGILSTSIYDLVFVYVCHFHQVQSQVKLGTLRLSRYSCLRRGSRIQEFFCEKSVRENFCNFHTVSTTLSSRASRKNRKSLEKFSSNKSLFADATEPHMKSFLYAAAASATP